MKSLIKQLEDYLRENWDWHHKGDLLAMTWVNKKTKVPYMSETVGRALRDLESRKIIARKDDKNGKSCVYKWLNPERRPNYIPWIERPLNAKNVMFKELPK